MNLYKYYQVGGTLKPDDPSYITREADNNLYNRLKNSEFCYVFNSRQMGKSSLLVRVRKQLESEGFKCVMINFVGSQVDPERWYFTFTKQIVDSLHLQINSLSTWWEQRKLLTPVQKLDDFIGKVLLTNQNENIIIFIDEIDTVLSLNFPTEDFFAFIRNCYNERANNPNYDRISFALFGVATPSQLIKDTLRTPFNIGHGIQLHPFTVKEATKLANGLNVKFDNIKTSEHIVQEIINWTGGQPFLTQKICKLLVDSDIQVPTDKSDISKCIKNFIHDNIINDWENQDEPQHLRTITNRIINSVEPSFKLLKLYTEIIEIGEVNANNTPEEGELILSGLIVKNNNTLRIHNRIYASIFNGEWVKEMRKGTRAYEEEITAWIASGRRDISLLLKAEQLEKAIKWSNDNNNILIDEDYQFLKASEELEITQLKLKLRKKRQTQRWFIPTVACVAVATGIIVNTEAYNIPSYFQPYLRNPEIFSEGSQAFFIGNGNSFQIAGIDAFKNSNYKNAINKLKDAKELDRNDPEVEIYYNNGLARLSKNYFTLAVAVPISARREMAREILRGVAQSQAEFNDNGNGGSNGRLLNIVIADDRNNINQGRIVAQEFVKDNRVLGVIGHNGSSVTKEAVDIYQKAGLAIISPSSTSTELKNSKTPVFFRTVSSDEKSGEKLAKYAIEKGIRKVTVFYKKDDTYSESLRKSFSENFQRQGGEVILSDFSLANNREYDPDVELYKSSIKPNTEAIVLFPNIEFVATAINIAKAHEQQQKRFGRNIQLLGGDALYGADTIQLGKQSVLGLTLAVPWFNLQNQGFAKRACERWGGAASWRTAAAYDATQAFVNAISEISKSNNNITRAIVIKKLNTIQLSPQKTSGEELRFQSGESNKEPKLVQVVKGNNDNCSGSKEAGFRFELIK